jgi:hypothetical protein
MRRGPNAIDPASGFKVKLSDLVKQWDGELIDRRFVDRRNPQDFMRSIPERPLTVTRPEPAIVLVAQPIFWENGTIIETENSSIVMLEGAL